MQVPLVNYRTLFRCLLVFILAQACHAQMFPPPPRDTRPARAAAPVDLTGYWVSVVTEDWRYRMRTPPRGDYPGLFLNPRAREIADNWDPERDQSAGEACRAYGAGAIMRVPGRLHVTWLDDNTLSVETDAGMQQRVFRFDGDGNGAGAGTWQGISTAEWTDTGPRGPVQAGSGEGGSLKVLTTAMRPGYIRKNGVPYSDKARLTEYYDIVTEDNGDQYLIVISILEDPEYLLGPVITSSNFRRQSGRKGWDPQPCSAR